uniref:FAR-17a/AIG1-like protein n=1 Tax=Schistosoma mansoni TaxID=6183 RepID=A0A5K4F163_SCHMA
MAIVLSVLHRSVALCFFIYIVFYTYQLFHGNDPFHFKDLAFLLRFLTILTISLQIAYYALATPLQYFKIFKMHSSLYSLAFTANLIVCIMFWGIFISDKTLLANESEMKSVPWWYNHACHTIGTPAIIIDALLWRPTIVPISNSILFLLAYFGGYLIHVEYLIRIHSFYPYPVLAVFSDVGRFGFYSVTIMATVLCFGVSVLMVRSLNKTQYKRLSSKTQQRTERKESVPVQSKHKKSKKTD